MNDKITISTAELFRMFPDQEAALAVPEGESLYVVQDAKTGKIARTKSGEVQCFTSQPLVADDEIIVRYVPSKQTT